VAPFNNVALPSNHLPPPKLNLNSKKRKRKKREKRKKEKNKNQNMDYKSRLRMYVPFVYHENEYIHNVIGVAKRYFLNLDLKISISISNINQSIDFNISIKTHFLERISTNLSLYTKLLL
jgi:hypothetical protein